MTADIVNLRKVRKGKARVERDRRAEENRCLHGMTRAEREKTAHDREKLDRHLRGHRRDGDDGAP